MAFTPSGDVWKIVGAAAKSSGLCSEEEWRANARMMAAATDLLEACREAAKTFRRYEQLHRAKGTEEGWEKAYANHLMAEVMEAAIAKATGSTP